MGWIRHARPEFRNQESKKERILDLDPQHCTYSELLCGVVSYSIKFLRVELCDVPAVSHFSKGSTATPAATAATSAATPTGPASPPATVHRLTKAASPR
jgi:hypothetical protein